MHKTSTKISIPKQKIQVYFKDYFGNDDTLPMLIKLEKPKESWLKDHLSTAIDVNQQRTTREGLQNK